jgi:hypothetical protein
LAVLAIAVVGVLAVLAIAVVGVLAVFILAVVALILAVLGCRSGSMCTARRVVVAAELHKSELIEAVALAAH